MSNVRNHIGNIDVGKIIQNDFFELLEKENSGTLTNDDFMKTWTDVVLLPIASIEDIVSNSKHTEVGYTKNQAVLYGLLLRIMSLLIDERRLACKQLINYNMSTVFSRMIIETTVNFIYLLQNQDYIVTFCKLSAKADKEFIHDIYRNRRRRKIEGGDVDEQYLKYEEGLLESAKKAVIEAGANFSKDNLKQKSIKEKVKAVGYERLYSSFGLESHAIHGDWLDISRNYLVKEGDMYYPKFHKKYTDIRKLNPILTLIYEALSQFIVSYEGHGIDKEMLQRLQQESDIVNDLDLMHYNFVHGRAIVK